MNKRLYVAYGSNLNFKQMKYRCPTAKLYGIGTIEDYELQFKGDPNNAYATIAPKENSSVPVAVWEIKPLDERSLDLYEGYPSHYFKQDVPVQLDGGGEVNAMVYIMNLKMQFGIPSSRYYHTVCEGYNDCGLDTYILNQAVQDSAASFFAFEPQNLFNYEAGSQEDYSETDESEEIDENDPFYFSDGMRF